MFFLSPLFPLHCYLLLPFILSLLLLSLSPPQALQSTVDLNFKYNPPNFLSVSGHFVSVSYSQFFSNHLLPH
jgi:hypothetical protein